MLAQVRDAANLAARELLLLRGQLFDASRPVDEELSGPSPLTVHPDFDTVDELITTILVSIPAAVTGAPISQAFAAAGTTTITLPAGSSLSGFTVTAASQAGAAVSGIVTVTGGNGGTLSYDYVFPNASNSTPDTTFTFPAPIAPASIAVPIQVVFPAIVGGAAGHITAYTTTGGLPGTLNLGTRSIPVVPGTQVIGPMRMILSKTDQRQLIWPGGGTGELELMGFAFGDAG